jgi:HEPN domain-containing protein
MRALTLEWVEKAEGDYNTATREYRARKSPNYDAVCFHCQQCAEKYLKALLQEREKYFPLTHKLITLLELCLEDLPDIELHRETLKTLDRYAVIFRYPGENAIKSDARSAIKSLRDFRLFARTQLELD